MKKILLTASFIGAIFMVMFGISKMNNSTKHAEASVAKSDPAQFTLIELFTSEGCSSCPAADELLNAVAKEKRANVFILSYHVDYWNSLGWADPFSKAAFSDRQRNYAALLSGDVYTPQVVVNGRQAFVGSDASSLYKALKTTGDAKNTAVLSLAASYQNDKVSVSFKTANSSAALNIALVQLSASSQVKRGENEGKLLQHTNIVTSFKTVTAATHSGTVDLNVPVAKTFTAGDFKVVAFLQEPNGAITAVSEVPVL